MAADEEMRAKLTLDSQQFQVGVGDIVAKLNALEAAVGSVGNKLENSLDKSLGGVQKKLEALTFEQLADQASSIGDKLTGAFGSVVGPAVDFQAAMNNVNTVAKLGDDQLAQLSNQMRTLGRDIGIGIKPTDAAAAPYDILSAGFPDAADATKVLTASAVASRAGLVTVQQSADLLTIALGAYGQGADQAQRFTDVLFNSIDKGKVTFEQYTQGLGQVVPAAASSGVSLEELTSAVAALTVTGTKAPQAFTGLNAAIVQLKAPTDTARKAALEFGVNLDDAAFKSLSFVQKLQFLAKAAGKNQSALRQVLGDINALSVAYALAGNAAKPFEEALAGANNALGKTAFAAAQNEKGVAAAQARFEAAGEAFKIALSESILPTLSSLADLGTQAIRFFDDMSPAAKNTAAAILEIGAAFGVIAGTVGAATFAFKTLGAVFTTELVFGAGAASTAMGVGIPAGARAATAALARTGSAAGLTSAALGVQLPGAAVVATGSLGAVVPAANGAAASLARVGAVLGRLSIIGIIGTALIGLANHWVEVEQAALKAADAQVNAAGKTSAAVTASTGAIISQPVEELRAQGVGAEDVRNRIRPLRARKREQLEEISDLDKQIKAEKESRNPIAPRIAELEATRAALLKSSEDLEKRIAELVAVEAKIGEKAVKDQKKADVPQPKIGVPVDDKAEKERRKQALFEIENSKLVGEERIKQLQAYIDREKLTGDERRKVEREIFQEREKLENAAAAAAKKAADDRKADSLQEIELSKGSHAQKIQQFNALLAKYKDDADFRRTILRQIAQEEDAIAKQREDKRKKDADAAKKAQDDAKEQTSEQRGAQQDAISLRQDALDTELDKAKEKGQTSSVKILLAERQRLTEETIRLQLAEQLAATESAAARVQMEANAEERIRQERAKTADEFKKFTDQQIAEKKKLDDAMNPKGPSTEFTGGVLSVEQMAEQSRSRFGSEAVNSAFSGRQQATAAARAQALASNLSRLQLPQQTLKNLAPSAVNVKASLEPLTIEVKLSTQDGSTQTQKVVIPGVPGPGQGNGSSISFSPRGRA